MKALSIKQPWAWLIAAGYKDIENRVWSTKNFRGRVYIHTGKHVDNEGFLWLMHCFMREHSSLNIKLPHGAIIGEVDIVACVTQSESPWFTGPYGFVLANPVLYEKPIPCKGRLGFFEPDIPHPTQPNPHAISNEHGYRLHT